MLRKDFGGLRPINGHREHLRAANIDAHQTFAHTQMISPSERQSREFRLEGRVSTGEGRRYDHAHRGQRYLRT